MPDDLLRDASRRVRVMSLVAAALWVVATVLYHLVDRILGHGESDWWWPKPSDAISGVAVAVSLALFAYTRRPGRDPRVILDLGLVHMVLMALGVGLIWHWDPAPTAPAVAPVITWIGTIVLMFAAIVPTSPVKVLVAGLVAVSMNPVGMLVARARGTWDFGPVYNVLVMHYPDYMLVGVAVVIAHVVTRLGQQIAKAREMGSYQIGELIGRGGMGEVYRATHRMLARPAAVKLIRPEAIGAASRGEGAGMAGRRFRREAEAAASLRSPHTVELYDFGVTGDGTLYFAMELLDGMDLESLVRQKGPLPAARVIHVLRQACESLEEAHARGLVHRDIKPANIHLGRLGLQHDFVKVLDFGLVTSIAGDRHQTMATAAGVLPGTPAYIAPEMAVGSTVDGRADLYSLGAVAYFLLSGTLVFEGTGMQMIVRRLEEPPPPLSERTEIAVPPALEALVLACLARNPEDRPASAAALREALAAVDVPIWTEEQAREWWTINNPRRGPITTIDLTRTAAGDDETTAMRPAG
jgi:eukaryotic-like serine/threonine-protein kinase